MAGRTTVARGRPDPHALHVYLLEVAAGDAREGAWSRLLAPEEAARRARLRHPASRSEYTAARALVRTALSLHAPLVSPAQWRIEADPRGRPRIVSPGTALDFNLAHTRGLVCCLIFTGRRAGIDVEWMDRPGDLRRVARRFFSPDEVADLERQREPSAFRRRFFDYWTLKEAWLKAMGLGLRLPLSRFTFTPGDPIRVRFDPPIREDADAWRFFSFDPLPTHRLSVAAERCAGPPTLHVHWLDPTPP